MIHSALGAMAIIIGLAAVPTAARAIAADVLVEAPPATRVVLVGRADLTRRDGLAALQRKLRTAARAACKEQYPNSTYYFSRACNSGSFRDALAQLRDLRARQLNRHAGVGVQLAISIRAR